MAGSKWNDQSGVVPAECDADNPREDRETGIVEKLLNTYGFIRCCDRAARLFFHYSQYEGIIEHLKLGDPVDFEMTFDKKSGKPIAIQVQKICSDTSINVGAGHSLVNGVVTLELNVEGKGGRVAYENCGECFFFEFARKDLVDPVQDNPRTGQPVQFVITQDAAGNLQVGEVRSVTVTPPTIPAVKPQQFITTSLVYPNMMVPMMPGINDMMSPQVIAYAPAPALQMSPVVNGVGPIAMNGRMLHTGINGNGKDVELLAGHSQAQPVYKVNLNNSLVQQQQNIQHYSGQSTKNNITGPQQLAHQAGGSGSLAQTAGASQNSTPSHTKGQQQNNTNINNKKNNSLRVGDDIDQQQNNDENDVRYQGVVCTIKDTYGFVERADVVKEIFFHCSEGYSGIVLGDDVSFNITSRQNRTVAINLQRLPAGTVIFSDLEEQPRKGSVLKLYNQSEEPLNGRIICDDNGEEKEFGFGDRDLAPSTWSMKEGDPVLFQVATDRRDHAQHATNIMMNVGASNAFTKEIRLTGTVATLKDNYGFVLTEQDNQKYYFKLSEVLDPELRIDNTVQFSLGADFQNGTSNNSTRQVAIRICKAPSQGKKKSSRKSTVKCTHKGFISALKEHFGFIESENHQEDLFFHYTNVDGDIKDLQIGSEVEYSLVSKKDRPSAEVVRLLDKGSIPPMEPVTDEVFSGRVIRALRCHNPDQTPYCGLLEITTTKSDSKESSDASDSGGDSQEEDQQTSNESGKQYEFSVLSLARSGEVMQKGDLVEFQLATCQVSDTVFAINVKSVRKTATIELMKGSVAYLSYELDGGRKLSFNISEVTKKPSRDFAAGDVVAFDLARSGRHQKLVAVNVKRIREKEASPRPAALVNRIKQMAISDEGPKVVAIRQPKGPDGTKGFTQLIAASA